MKYLRKYIRQILLTEAAKTQDLLPEYVSVLFKDFGQFQTFRFILLDEGGQNDLSKHKGIEDNAGHPVWGKIVIQKTEEGDGFCENAYKVSQSFAASGWGPFLYDIAIEYATQHGTGLMPDRFLVSDEARGVWDYYLNNRSDIQVHQLDNLQDSFNNGPEDDCDQTVAELKPGSADAETLADNQYWVKSAMSKRYTKDPTTINSLKAKGKWVEVER